MYLQWHKNVKIFVVNILKIFGSVF